MPDLPDIPSALPDLSDLILRDLRRGVELPTILREAVDRVAAEVDSGAEPVAGFQSAI